MYCAVRTEYLNVIRVNLQMANTAVSSSVARSKLTDVAAMLMTAGQTPRTGG